MKTGSSSGDSSWPPARSRRWQSSDSVSYPTVRARLDRLIAKINAAESPASRDAFERKIKILVADGQLSVSLGKELLTDYRRTKKRDES